MRNLIIAILLFASPCLYAQNQPTFEQALQDAKNGDSSAYGWVGAFYYRGEGVARNFSEAIKWLKKAAETGDRECYGYLGSSYFELQNYQEAVVWLKKAANNGDTRAYGTLGASYMLLKQYTEAISWLKKVADYGDKQAYMLLSECYYAQLDYEEAITWAKKAADNGVTRAYAALGASYMQLKQYSEAIPWLKKAVDNNEIQAFYWLGIYYNIQQNDQEAYKWIKKAAESNICDAYCDLGIMYLNGIGTSINKNEAFKWIKKSAENGIYDSFGILGWLFYNGDGTQTNIQEAYKWAKLGIEKDVPLSMYLLSRMYKEGKGVSKDTIKSFEWLKKAAEKGYIDAYLELGTRYENGFGTLRNIKEAIKWYQKAYDGRDPDASEFLCMAYYKDGNYTEARRWAEIVISQNKDVFIGYRTLACLYMYGYGVEKDKTKAFELMSQAIDEAKKAGIPTPNTLDTEGELYLADNDVSKAREIYNTVLKETPEFYAQTETKLSKYMKEHKGGDVDFEMPIVSNINDKTFAVIIANEKYQMEKSVEYATNDGKVFMEYCKKTLGLPERNVHYIADATLNNIKYEVKWLQNVIAVYKGDSKVIFYYAGHGIPDEKNKSAYILPIDGYGSDAATGYALEDLYKALGSLPSKSVTIFLDACFSGAKRDGDMLASARGVAIKTRPTAPIGNMVVFTAAQGDETAYPYKEQEHGLFTYYLLKKLQETKGDVTLGELGDYIKTQVERQSVVTNGKLQSPSIMATSSVGNDWRSWKLNQ